MAATSRLETNPPQRVIDTHTSDAQPSALRSLVAASTAILIHEPQHRGSRPVGLEPVSDHPGILQRMENSWGHFRFNTNMAIWNKIYTKAFDKELPTIPLPRDENLGLALLGDVHPTMDIPGVYVTPRTPAAETSCMQTFTFSTIRALTGVLSLHQPGVGRVPADPRAYMDLVYPEVFRTRMPVPEIGPAIIARPHDLPGAMALNGPFAAYIARDEAAGIDCYKIDLAKWRNYPTRDGLETLGGVARLKWNAQTQQMETYKIELGSTSVRPGDADWDKSQKVIMCTLSTSMTVLRHLLNAHFIVAGTFAAATSALPSGHALRRLLHPHFDQSIAANNDKIPNLINSDQAVFPSIFSFNQTTIIQIMTEAAVSFYLEDMDIHESATKRKMTDKSIPYTYQNNVSALWDIFEDYATQYIDSIYPSDAALQQDVHANNWYKTLDDHIPNGIKRYAPVLDKANLVKLVTMLIHTVVVEHENVGNVTWKCGVAYPQYIPTMVPEDGGLPPLAVGRRALQALFSTNQRMNPLVADNSHLALTRAQANIMRAFQERLKNFQMQEGWLLDPKQCEISVST